MRFFQSKLFQPGAVLFFTIAFTIAYFFFAHEGFYFNDDFGYARLSTRVLNGNFRADDLPAYHRFLIFWPAAFLLNIFGISIYSLTLWPLLCTIGSLVITYLLFRKQDKILCGFALILVGLHFHTLFLSNYFFPDNILQFFALATAGSLYAARRTGRNHGLYAVVFVLSGFCAFLSKETIFFYVPFFIWVAITDYLHDKNILFWRTSIISGAIVAGLYLLYYKLIFGSFFYRFTMLENTHLLMAESENYRDIDLMKRLVTAPIPFLINTGIFFPLAFCFFYFRRNSLKQLLNPDFSQNFWMLLALSGLFLFWFGSTSLESYRPITLVARMAAPVLPPLGIAAAYQLRNFFSSRRGSLWFAIPLLLAAIYTRSEMSIVYGLPALYFIYLWWKSGSKNLLLTPEFCLLILTAILALRPLHFMRKPTVSSFFEQEEVVEKYLKNAPENSVVFTDGWFEKSQAYYFDFEIPANIRVLNYDEWVAQNSTKAATSFLLINESTLTNPDLQFKKPEPGFTITLPEINRRFPAKKLVAEKGKVRLYQLLPATRETKVKAE